MRSKIGKNVDIIERAAAKMGLNPRVSYGERASVYIYCGSIKIRVSDHPACYSGARYSVSPTEGTVAGAVALLCEENEVSRPGWVTRALREEAAARARVLEKMREDLEKMRESETESA